MSSPTTGNSDDEANAVYSSTIHKAVIFTIGGAFGLLQLVTNQSNWAPSKAPSLRGSITILFFLVFFFIYLVLRVCEAMLQNKPRIRNVVGHVSHLFGVLAALLLISLTAPIFTLIVFPLLLGWFFFVIYRSFSQLKEKEPETFAV